MIIKYYQR